MKNRIQLRSMEKINMYKREMNYLRKSIRPAREAIQQLTKLENELIHEDTIPFLKDLPTEEKDTWPRLSLPFWIT